MRAKPGYIPVKEKLILYNDFSASNETRLGAMRDLDLAVSVEQPDLPVLVIAGDTIFSHQFSLASFLQTWDLLQGTGPAPILLRQLSYAIKNQLKLPKAPY